MKPGQSIVYILDCSGSMGEHGKLDPRPCRSPGDLKSLSPKGVRFQVIVYDCYGSRRFFPA